MLKRKIKNRVNVVFLAFLFIPFGCTGLIKMHNGTNCKNGNLNDNRPENSIIKTATLSAPIIANHQIVNKCRFDEIPESAINHTKETLHIAYGHTSHGSQITDGMSALPAFKESLGGKDGLYDWNDGPLAGALDIDDYAFPNDVGYSGWDTETRNYLNDPAHSDVNVVMWSWCGQVNDHYDQDMIDYYLAPMTQLETEYPNVIFIYMTGHLEGEGEVLTPGTVYYSNQQIRNYCTANNKVLYDFEDIESFTPDGVNVRAKGATDECWYDSDGTAPFTLDANWALEYQSTHDENVDWYSCSCIHSYPINGNMKAYAAWWLFARIAGWNEELPDDSANDDNNDNDTSKNETDDSESEPNIFNFKNPIVLGSLGVVIGAIIIAVIVKKKR